MSTRGVERKRVLGGVLSSNLPVQSTSTVHHIDITTCNPQRTEGGHHITGVMVS